MQMALGAYGKVAFKRAIDHVPNIVDHQLLHTLHDDIMTKTCNISDKELEGMLRADDDTLRRRRELKGAVSKYDGVMKAFHRILKDVRGTSTGKTSKIKLKLERL